ncbi:hypothetical protein L195_g047334 [Trifolium pratense]|uniref:Uncharacterized protein n=1 Tax=Trifolium pratense TaxID=57577 RepID=A0A2K3MKB1_TRIPR|nr:hypothetical protein L195_g056576 [Trifolium pratense]PNX91204.1 hypothetical protein L195_g047334 [Trifolium pratense]
MQHMVQQFKGMDKAVQHVVHQFGGMELGDAAYGAPAWGYG